MNMPPAEGEKARRRSVGEEPPGTELLRRGDVRVDLSARPTSKQDTRNLARKTCVRRTGYGGDMRIPEYARNPAITVK